MVELVMNYAVMLGEFFGYLFAAFGLLVVFTMLYAVVTPVPEFSLIHEGNVSAAVSLSGAILGFILPLASIVAYSLSLRDMLFWGVVALVVQVIVHFLIRIVIRDWAASIRSDKVSVAILCAVMSLAAGLVNAACMVF
jgi:putative membrane protein